MILSRATVAQSAEHLTRNEDVRGSIPRGGSNCLVHFFSTSAGFSLLLLLPALGLKEVLPGFRNQAFSALNADQLLPFIPDLPCDWGFFHV
jgi:hypothetical protein